MESIKWYVKKEKGKSGNPHTESSLLKSTRPNPKTEERNILNHSILRGQ